jgi:hypothetical protein
MTAAAPGAQAQHMFELGGRTVGVGRGDNAVIDGCQHCNYS